MIGNKVLEGVIPPPKFKKFGKKRADGKTYKILFIKIIEILYNFRKLMLF